MCGISLIVNKNDEILSEGLWQSSELKVSRSVKLEKFMHGIQMANRKFHAQIQATKDQTRTLEVDELIHERSI